MCETTLSVDMSVALWPLTSSPSVSNPSAVKKRTPAGVHGGCGCLGVASIYDGRVKMNHTEKLCEHKVAKNANSCMTGL